MAVTARTPLRSNAELLAAFNAAMTCRDMPARYERAWDGLVHRSLDAAPRGWKYGCRVREAPR